MSSPSTKDRILDAAERLFAEQGFAGTSLRCITSAADVNLAAVNYHFGSKEALLKAVFQRRLSPINEQRIQELDGIELKSDPDGPSLEDVLRALLGPAIRMRQEWGEHGDLFMQFAGRAHSDSDQFVRSTFLDLFKEIFQRFFPVFKKVLPGLSQEVLILRIHYVIGAMAHTMAWNRKIAWIYEWPPQKMSVDVHLEHLVQFAAAGMRASLPGPGRENKPDTVEEKGA